MLTFSVLVSKQSLLLQSYSGTTPKIHLYFAFYFIFFGLSLYIVPIPFWLAKRQEEPIND